MASEAYVNFRKCLAATLESNTPVDFSWPGMTALEACAAVVECTFYHMIDEVDGLLDCYGDLSAFDVRFTASDSLDSLEVSSKFYGDVLLIQSLDRGHAVEAWNAAEWKNSRSFERVINALLRSGIGGALFPGNDSRSFFAIMAFDFYNYSFSGCINPLRDQRVPIDLPILMDLRLDNPELVAVLQGRRLGAAAPAFHSVLFYASPAMISKFTDYIEPLSIFRGVMSNDVEGRSVFFEYRDGVDPMSDAHLVYDIDIEDNRGFSGFSGKRYDIQEFVVGYADLSSEDEMLVTRNQFRAIAAYDSMNVVLENNIDEGLVLCAAPLSFLAGFDAGPFSHDRASVITSRLDCTNAAELIAGECIAERAGSTLLAANEMIYSSAMIEIAGLCDESIEIIDKFPWSAWRHAYGQSSLKGVGVLRFFERHVTDGSDAPRTILTHNDVLSLFDSGYKFLPGSQIKLEFDLFYDKSAYLKSCVRSIIAMADEPITLEGIGSHMTPDELLAGVLNNNVEAGEYNVNRYAMVLEALAELYGYEALKDSAKEDRHWDFLVNAFGRDALISDMASLPLSAKRAIVEGDFNL